jgi:hypothetical protein
MRPLEKPPLRGFVPRDPLFPLRCHRIVMDHLFIIELQKARFVAVIIIEKTSALTVSILR